MKIYYLNGAEAGKTVTLSPTGLTIGRETDNDIQLLVGGVSRYHARIESNGGRWMLRDLGSTNGTRVNGSRITAPVELADGDMVVIGDQHFRINRLQTQDSAAPANTVLMNGSNEKSASVPPVDQTVVPEPAPAFVFRPDIPPSAPPPENIFRKTDESGADKQTVGKGLFKKNDNRKSSLKGNLIFAAVLTLMLVIGAALIANMMKKDQQADKNQTVAVSGDDAKLERNPFFFYWERQEVDSKTRNIFKFKVHGEQGYDPNVTKKDENGDPKLVKRFFVTTTLDDLANGRQFYKKFGVDDKITPEQIEALRKRIERSGFMNLDRKQVSSMAGNPNYERLVIGYGDKLRDVVYYDGDGGNNIYFSDAVRIIRQFIEEEVCATHGISIVNTAEEISRRAQEFFTQAQRADENHVNDPRDLRLALNSYRRAELLYMQFRQKPKEYEIVVERLAKLRKIHDEKVREGVDRINQAHAMGDLTKAVQLCETYMKYFPEGSAGYNRLRTFKLKIEAERRKSLKGK